MPGGSNDFERSPPTVKPKLQARAMNLGEQPARRWITTLTNDVHLHIVDAFSENEIQVSWLVGLVNASRYWDQVQVFETPVALMIRGR